MYGRAALTLLPRRRPSDLPSTVLSSTVVVDRDHLAEYDRVCGFRLGDTLPATYPHVLAFPLALELMTSPDFPFPVVGLIHVANRISLLRPISLEERLSFSVRAADLRPHDRGRQLDIIASASVDGEEVWRDVSTYLRKEKSSSSSSGPREEAPPASAVWKVPAKVGSEYAAVSGDRNPIHTSTLAAKAFGFPRRIAHGMWSKARCLAALEGRLPPSYTVDVAFKRPILLPSTVPFRASPTSAGWTFTIPTHLTGSVSPSSA
jgi:hypothetical protein